MAKNAIQETFTTVSCSEN